MIWDVAKLITDRNSYRGGGATIAPGSLSGIIAGEYMGTTTVASAGTSAQVALALTPAQAAELRDLVQRLEQLTIGL